MMKQMVDLWIPGQPRPSFLSAPFGINCILDIFFVLPIEIQIDIHKEVVDRRERKKVISIFVSKKH
jgi:hypothetical protein